MSTGCGRKSRSVRAWRWICGVKPKPKAGNKPLHHFIVHGLDKPGSSATVSIFILFFGIGICAGIDERQAIIPILVILALAAGLILVNKY